VIPNGESRTPADRGKGSTIVWLVQGSLRSHPPADFVRRLRLSWLFSGDHARGAVLLEGNLAERRCIGKTDVGCGLGAAGEGRQKGANDYGICGWVGRVRRGAMTRCCLSPTGPTKILMSLRHFRGRLMLLWFDFFSQSLLTSSPTVDGARGSGGSHPPLFSPPPIQTGPEERTRRKDHPYFGPLISFGG
jgi:hypothetical protein